MIKLDNLQCGYGKKVVLKNISGNIKKGELTCLLGKNGAGKTTLFKTILGILPALGGEIYYDNKTFQSFNSKKFARYISYVPQAHGTPFSFSVLDVVLMGQYASSGNTWGKPGKKSMEIALECIHSLGINHLVNKTFSKLSGGEKQMVLIARAMAQQPVFIAMDEPTSNLDLCNQVKVLQYAKILTRQGFGVIMNTHSPQQVLQYADTAILLDKGSIKQWGNPNDILTTTNVANLYDTSLEIIETTITNGDTRKILVTI